MKREKIKIRKSVRNLGFVVKEKKEKAKGIKDYYIISPKGKRTLEIIKRPEGVFSVMTQDDYCYCREVRLIVKAGKVIALCKTKVAFNVLVERRIKVA